ncbi:LysR family transcriptional regulator, hydrogen peroxide-inducible genes activator [Rhodococcus maanshanensis]|uniref:Probable hydrogen peroxide-inducible genes activator n=2 Tax=Rhodococcus maanshanensis TaxID=183556 RepID=A0A1H7GNV0_9NOCA|nr:LysR family transcriptional regulator, hydrogen peroxide-inducible genes activator [Rhodococcus maanshanensis]
MRLAKPDWAPVPARASLGFHARNHSKVKAIYFATLIGMADQTYQPTLSQLRAFVAVAEYRHFGTAAARLNVSQPTLSQALAALENGLGVQLIERSTRRVLVTDAGTQLLAQAKMILEAADGFVATAAGVGDRLGGPLRMGLIPTVAPYVLPALLPAMRAELPAVVPQVIEDQTARLLDSLRAGVLDVAVMALPSDATGLVEIPLYTEDFVLVVPGDHELAGRVDLSLQVLDDLPLLLLDEGHCLRDQTLDLCRSVDAHPSSGDTRATSLATVVQCVAGGLGVTLVPDSAVPVETRRGDLATARFASPAPGRTIGLVFRSSSGRADGYRRLADVVRSVAPGDVAPPSVGSR